MIDEIKKYDISFSEETFKAKASNIFIKILYGIMSRNLTDIEHFLNEDVRIRYDEIINDLKNKKLIQMYDELNVFNVQINNFDVKDNIINIYTTIIGRHMDYRINEDTKRYVDGVNDHRLTVQYDIVFSKPINAGVLKINRQCPNCGNSLSINSTGKCNYCGQIYYQEGIDYIVTDIKKENSTF